MAHRVVLAALLVVAAMASPGLAATIHVPGDEPTIQAGIHAASVGDTVEVACGTYYEHGIELASGIVLRSATGSADCVVVDAQELDRVMLCEDLAAPAVVEGFSLVSGMLDEDFGAGAGAGMHVARSTLTVRNCRIADNTARYTGGLFAAASDVFLEGCAFENNYATWDAGALYVHIGSRAQIVSCDFYGNNAWVGSILRAADASVSMRGCVLRLNSDRHGSIFAPFLTGGCDVSVEDCQFSNNTGVLWCAGGSLIISRSTFVNTGWVVLAKDLAEVRIEDSILAYNPYGVVQCWNRVHLEMESVSIFGSVTALRLREHTWGSARRCTFSGNDGIYGAIGVRDTSSYVLDRCTFAFNRSQTGPPIDIYNRSELTITSSIIAFNEGDIPVACDALSTAEAFCTDAYGHAAGDWIGCLTGQADIRGNFSADPLFCAPDARDFTLRSDSPCAPESGPTGCGLVGALGVGCGPVSLTPESWARVKARYR